MTDPQIADRPEPQRPTGDIGQGARETYEPDPDPAWLAEEAIRAMRARGY